jgi:hypothetical protein
MWMHMCMRMCMCMCMHMFPVRVYTHKERRTSRWGTKAQVYIQLLWVERRASRPASRCASSLAARTLAALAPLRCLTSSTAARRPSLAAASAAVRSRRAAAALRRAAIAAAAPCWPAKGARLAWSGVRVTVRVRGGGKGWGGVGRGGALGGLDLSTRLVECCQLSLGEPPLPRPYRRHPARGRSRVTDARQARTAPHAP